METVSAQEYQSVFSELQSLKEKFVAPEQENHRLLGDLQQTVLEKQQQHGELTLLDNNLKRPSYHYNNKDQAVKGFTENPRSVSLQNLMGPDHSLEDSSTRYV